MTNLELEKLLEPLVQDSNTRGLIYHIVKSSVAELVTVDENVFIKDNDTIIVNGERIPLLMMEDAYDNVTKEDDKWIHIPFNNLTKQGDYYYFYKKGMDPGSASFINFKYTDGVICKCCVDGFIADVVRHNNTHFTICSPHAHFTRFDVEFNLNTRGLITKLILK